MLKELEYWNHNTAYYKWIKKQLKQSNRILDIGCGDGLLIRYLDDGSKFLVGIDSDKFALKKRRNELRLHLAHFFVAVMKILIMKNLLTQLSLSHQFTTWICFIQ